jgi:hypothetical protein
VDVVGAVTLMACAPLARRATARERTVAGNMFVGSLVVL